MTSAFQPEQPARHLSYFIGGKPKKDSAMERDITRSLARPMVWSLPEVPYACACFDVITGIAGVSRAGEHADMSGRQDIHCQDLEMDHRQQFADVAFVEDVVV